jgi:lipoyl(octanoyl) transferase
MNHKLNTATTFQDLGLINYQEAWDFQTSVFEKTVAVKVANRTLAPELHEQTPNYLFFCEHPHVFTLGKSGDEKNLLASEEQLKEIGASFYRINRGGDITYHGPGQIVGYPVIDLENFFTDIHLYMRRLEEAVIKTLAHFGVSGGRIPGLTGVWINPEAGPLARKICALGVKTSRWVTMHGFAFNVNSDLGYFSKIVPCGIGDKAVTSLEKETGKRQDIDAVKDLLKKYIIEEFGMRLI